MTDREKEKGGMREEITKVIVIIYEEGINMCAKCQSSPSNCCDDIYLKTTNGNLVVSLEEKSVGFVLWRTSVSVQNVIQQLLF